MVNEDAKAFLKKCIEYYSPSGQEREYSEFLAKFLEKFGFNVEIDKVGNLIAKKGTGKPVLLLSSHIDTIPGLLPVIEKEGKIYGRGAVDCKASLAAMVYSITNYEFEGKNKGKIIFGGIVQEEDSLIGIEEFLKYDINPDYAIFGEPTDLNQICIGYKGRLCLSLKITTKAGHVACSWQFDNAIEIALEIWNIVKKTCNILNEKHIRFSNEQKKYFQMIIPTLSVISGGLLTNVVPSECNIKIDIRFPPDITSNEILSNLNDSINLFKHSHKSNQNKEFMIQEEILSQIEGFEIKGNELIVGALRWAIYNTIKQKPVLIKKTGTTFINQIGIQYKIPSITYGPGNPKLEHTDEEFIEVEDYLKAIEIYSKFISKVFENYQKKH
ncbi:MAG: M20/M25/M40 family metallo-hydrolase [Promethearchaeota archaeon]